MDLAKRLEEAGFAPELVKASLPAWWSSDEASSPSAQTLATLLLARRLSLDPTTLLDDSVPLGFLHAGPTKFKNIRLEAGFEKNALIAFGQGVARTIGSVADADTEIEPASARDLRQSILASGRDHVGFGDVLTLAWSLRVPVLHLTKFPSRLKGVTSLATRIGSRHSILIARDTAAPAQYMFHIAHELGHVVLRHLSDAGMIVDADPLDGSDADKEEAAADAFAQELLTGFSDFTVGRQVEADWVALRGNARELAARALDVGRALKIDPAHIAMCFGKTTGEWAVAHAAAKLLPGQEARPSELVNRVFWAQVSPIEDFQAASFLEAVSSAA